MTNQHCNHDFDFLFGSWTVHHRRLRSRLVGRDSWDDFTGSMTCRPILGGLGNIDEFHMPTRNTIGSTLRLFDLAGQRWWLYWSSNLTGRLEPPVVGVFNEGIGVFFGDDHHDDLAIRVRFVWDEITDRTARWQQAFSTHDDTWETNWVMNLERNDAP
ncbi:MAG TPA: hypothetical protein VFI46_03230 [Jiangellaceae bacterium]|nr:hypothetical protein [Jiangellaceae bacterium]